MSGKFFMFFCHLLIFFKVSLFEKFFQEYHQSVKQFGSRSVGPDLVPNCLPKISADDTRTLGGKELTVIVPPNIKVASVLFYSSRDGTPSQYSDTWITLSII